MKMVKKWLKDWLGNNIRWIMLTVLSMQIVGLLVLKFMWWDEVVRGFIDLFK
ncbi:hypothetical protein [Bacillus cereus]|uniref:hypothetical protein n=1 Tax=Bacillus cereus TaxID=1396 RepID=UPI001C8B5186|nr:hypothetical protein [Bacillus cereus]MBX9158527.1 hypothetical protein [Bacillus cereus]